MSVIDWLVLGGSLAGIVLYGVWKGTANRNLQGFLLADRSMAWHTVALSIMATQASAITFLATPGQAYSDGMRFVQFYFGLPIAMVVLAATAVPIYHRLRVYTAYEYLESRFDTKTRLLAASLFLVQRGLGAGLTIYAPSIILSVLLGWNIHITNIVIGALVVIYTTSGGAKAVNHTQLVQMLILLAGIGIAFFMIVVSLPPGVSFVDALRVAGAQGRLNAVDFSFDPNNRYNFWSGLIGGCFLALSYFGTDQSQVGRYLTGQSVAQSRLGLLTNGILKVPMQFVILLAGAMVFVFFQFAPHPVVFNPVEAERARSGPYAAEFQEIEDEHRTVIEARAARAREYVATARSGDQAATASAREALREAQSRAKATREKAVNVIRRTDPGAQASDTNYVFLSFVLHHLPTGIIGIVLAAIFAASMSSTSAELNALSSTTSVDYIRRFGWGGPSGGRRDVWITRIATLFWGAFAIAFAEFASRLGSLIEAVNILGSLVYGTILGIFLVAFYWKRVGGTAVFLAALVAEAAVVWCFLYSGISFSGTTWSAVSP
jgi:Na+/proline symporter